MVNEKSKYAQKCNIPCFKELKLQRAGHTLTKAEGRALRWELFTRVQLLCEGEATGVMVLGLKAALGCLHITIDTTAFLASGKGTFSCLCTGMVEERALCSHLEKSQGREQRGGQMDGQTYTRLPPHTQ